MQSPGIKLLIIVRNNEPKASRRDTFYLERFFFQKAQVLRLRQIAYAVPVYLLGQSRLLSKSSTSCMHLIHRSNNTLLQQGFEISFRILP